MLRRVLFRLFWNTYDSLGAWVLLSLASCVLSLPVVTAPAAWGALLAAAGRADREEEVNLARYWRDFRHFAGRSTLFGLLLLVSIILGLSNLLFYSASSAIHLAPLPRLVLTVLAFWVCLFVLTGLQIAWAFMALQDIPLRKALKRGFLVMAAHPIVSIVVFVLNALFFCLAAASVLGAVLLYGALWANLFMAMAGSAVEFYEEIEDRKERERLKVEGARSWLEIRALDEREAIRHRRYNRSWRDILKPWEMK